MVSLFTEDNPGNEQERDQKEDEQIDTDDLDVESCMEKLC